MEKLQKNEFPIPARLNMGILLVVTGLYLYLQWQASHVDNAWWLVLLGFTFALIMIPVYSLIHEAEHGMVHPDKTWNYLAGVHLCNLFIAPFTFFRTCHLNHHRHNRTDVEMWDLYYEHQNRFLRYGNLYLMMIGFGYIMLPVSVVLSAIHPKLLYLRIFTSHTEISGFLEGSDKPEKWRRMQLESVGVIAFQVLIVVVLDLKLLPYAILLVCHGFVWSSQNYVNHAFAPRDIINGAHNHKMSSWFRLIYLNFNVHLAHHQNPHVPWTHLPRFIREGGAERIPFLKAYINLWKGPALTHEPAPRITHAEK